MNLCFNRKGSTLITVTIIFCSMIGIQAFCQTLPVGAEIPVSPGHGDIQLCPVMTSLADGRYWICWENVAQDASGYDIEAQLFEPTGMKSGQPIQINTQVFGDQCNPVMAALPDGNVVVCWQSDSPDGIFCQIVSGTGDKLGSEFQANSSQFTPTRIDNFIPEIIVLSNGDFFVYWQSEAQNPYPMYYHIYGQKFDSWGTKKGTEFLLNPMIQTNQQNPKIARLGNDEYVVCWSLQENDGDFNVYGQRFDAQGMTIGNAFMVNTFTQDNQWWATLAVLENGGFVVCWESMDQDGSSVGTYGQLFDSTGEKQGDEFLVNTYTNDWQGRQAVIGLPNGGFVVVWQSYGQDGSGWGIYGQLFDSNGLKIGHEFRINDYTANWQAHPCLMELTDGFVVSWASGMQYDNEYSIVSKYLLNGPTIQQLKHFSLIEPNYDATIKKTILTCRWQQPSTQIVCYPWELHYKIFIANNPDFTLPQIFEQDRDTSLTLQNLTPGKTYFWKVLAKNIKGDSLWSSNTNAFFVSRDATNIVMENKSSQPDQFVLHQNYPNPFNPETTIRFDLPETGLVEIAIYDITGKLIKVLTNESKSTGCYSVKWDGKDSAGNLMPSGIYICRMEAKTADGKMFVKSVKMGLVR